jgi:hypothetical protein
VKLSDMVYDGALLGGVIICGTVMAIFVHNMVEIAYWKYFDWKNRDESG